MGKFEEIKYKNQYNKEHYARLSISVPLSEREGIDAHWKAKGYKSFNSYVIDLIKNDMSNGHKTIIVENIMQDGDNNSVNIQ